MILKTILHGLIGAGVIAAAGYAWAEAVRPPLPEPLTASVTSATRAGETGSRLAENAAGDAKGDTGYRAVTGNATNNGYIDAPRRDTRHWDEREREHEHGERELEGGLFGLFGEDDDD